jgi:hypothetical protein
MSRVSCSRVLVPACLVAGFWLTGAAPAGAADLPEPKVTTDGEIRTFEFRSHTTSEKFVPKGGAPTETFPESQPKPGDGVSFVDELTQNGVKIGTGDGTCTFGDATPVTLACDVTMRFAKGTLRFAGTLPLEDEAPFTVPISGGTGVYDGARGEIRVVQLSEDDDSNTITYTTSAEGAVPQVRVTPTGGVATGAGATAVSESPWLLGLGAAALVVGAGVVVGGVRAGRRSA